MTESANWLHDPVVGLNPTVLEMKKAESDLNKLDVFAEKDIAT